MNIGGDLRDWLFCPSACPSFCVHDDSSSPRVIHNRQEWWRPPVKTSTFYSSNVYITSLGGDMHSHKRLLVIVVIVVVIVYFVVEAWWCINRASDLRGCQMIDKLGWFYLPTKSPNKNLLCVMQKSPDFVGQDRACSIFDDFVGRLFVYRTTNFVYVAMVIIYNGRWILILVI